MQGAGALPRALQQAWAALQRSLGRLCALGPEYADFEPGGTRERLASLASLRRLRTALAGKVRATLRAEDKDRVREGRAWLEEARSSDQGAVYRWLKDESYAPPVTFLSRPDGTATANLAEMDGLLKDAWRTKNRKYASDLEPDPVEDNRVRQPRAASPQDCLATRRPPPAQGAPPQEALGFGAGRMESG